MRTHGRFPLRLVGLILGITAGVFIADSQSGSTTEKPAGDVPPAWERSPRHPVALAVVDQGKLLFVANGRTGTVAVVTTEANRVIAEHEIARTLSDLTPLGSDDRHLMATDDTGHRLLLLSRNGSALAVGDSIGVPPFPVAVRTTDDGRLAFVTSLWSRQVSIVRCEGRGTDSPSLHLDRSVALPFAPRLVQWVPSASKLVVADAFGGHLALVHPETGKIESVRWLPAHNIRGLSLSPQGDRVLVAHQTLSRQAQTSFEDVHWGRLLTNRVQSLDIEAVLDPQADLQRNGRTIRLGDVGQAAGDPAGIAQVGARPETRIAVACAGIGEVAIFEEGSPAQERIPVGITPTTLVTNPVRPEVLYVVDPLGDTVSILELRTGAETRIQATISLAPQAERSLADQGERLFHDARRSHDGWMSCQSCHPDGHTTGLLNDNQGDGSFDAPKRILSLRGIADTAPFAWNGQTADLETQIRKSVSTTMLGPELSESEVAALAAYLRSLPPAPPRGAISENALDRAARDASENAVAQGQTIFARWKCDRCHTPPTYTSASAYDVGFEDEVGNREFNPPSLRGVSQRDGLFHDNRAGSLEDAFTRLRHQIPASATEREIADLIEFLRSL